jgi:hypothetical protein
MIDGLAGLPNVPLVVPRLEVGAFLTLNVSVAATLLHPRRAAHR